MNARLTSTIALGLVSPLIAACASKGWVKDQMMASNKVSTAYVDSSVNAAVAKEAAAREADDANTKTQIAQQQAALDSLRTQFHTAVSTMGSTIRFAVPVNFAFNDATVAENDYAALDKFAQVVSKFYGGSVVTVEGFADPAGSKAYNLALSKRRADAVSQYLQTKGLDAEHLRTVGYGKERLVHPDAQKDDPGAMQNRRAVFVVETAENAGATATMNTPQ